MLNTQDILETIQMIHEENLDIRTITMGISLWDCVSEDEDRLCRNIYEKIVRKAERLVPVGAQIEKQYGIPIVNKRVSVTPVSLIGGNCSPDGYLKIAAALQRAAKSSGDSPSRHSTPQMPNSSSSHGYVYDGLRRSRRYTSSPRNS